MGKTEHPMIRSLGSRFSIYSALKFISEKYNNARCARVWANMQNSILFKRVRNMSIF